MSETVIKVENLSKQYRLGVVGTGTLSHDLNRWWHKFRGKEDPYLKVGEVNKKDEVGGDYVWALKNINFEVNKGEVLGIIGKNGAGKSTLLKLLSQVTLPTEGFIKAKGRIASLLEVGTGFHPELTGRENIFLNGAILGMTKQEIKSKLDEIVQFSGVEKFIDTPVKRYSSGMKVRLGFAVAAHLEPEILIVDEVLAVGDAEFQKKCMGKMKDVSGEGRTVLFVSHNMASVKSLCTRGIVLNNGELAFSGSIDECVANYLKIGSVDGNTEYKIFEKNRETTSEDLEIHSVGVRSVGKGFGEPMLMSDEIELLVKFNKMSDKYRIDSTFQVKDSNGNYLFSSSTIMSIASSNASETGVFEHILKIPKNFFNAHSFYINLLIVMNKRSVKMRLDDVIYFNIIDKEREIGSFVGKSLPPLAPDFKWVIKK